MSRILSKLAQTTFLCLLCTFIACSSDNDSPAKKICNPDSTRDCVCTNTASGQQTCAEDGTRYGLCICGGSVSMDAGQTSSSDAMTSSPMDAMMPPPTMDGGMMTRPDRGAMMMDMDGGRRMPSQESYAACMGLSEGDACTFTHPRRGEVTGTCAYRPGETELFCRAPRGMGGGGMGGGGMGG